MKNLIFIILGTLLLSKTFSLCTQGNYQNIDWPETDNGTIANVTSACPDGRQAVFSRLCLSSSTWDDTVTNICSSQCPENVNGTVTYPATAVGNSTIVPCPSGYSGNHVRACSPAGVWEAPTGECVPVTSTGCSADSTGGYNWPAKEDGQEAESPCLPGFSGTATRLCTNGVWGEINTQNCQQLMCPEGAEGGVNWPATAAGQTANSTCPEGQVGLVTRQCLITGDWSSVNNTCTSEGCPAQDWQEKAWPFTAPGTTATSSTPCPAGYQGSYTRECLAGGIWSPTVIDGCVPLQCPEDNDGGMVYPATNANTTITVNCPAGQSGSKTRYCGITGQWSQSQGECTTLSCQAESDYVSWPTTIAGEEAEVDCPIGMKGQTKRKCSLTGTWETPSPDCGVYCEEEGSKPRTPAGMLREMECADGVQGSRYYYCRTDGQWGNTVSHCKTPHCNAGYVGDVYFSQTDAGSSVTVSCGEGFSGSYTRVCSEAGIWQAPTNNCVPTRCPAHVFSLPSGDYSIPMNVAGTVERNCASGFEGSVQFVCTEGFTWSDPVENCQRVKCSNTTLEGVVVGETDFGMSVVEPCSPGWEGSLNATCLSTGNWNIVSHCDQLFCDAEPESSGVNWPSTPAGVLSEVACSTVSPTKLGVYTRQCGLDGLWMDPVDGCMDSLPSSFQYDQSSITMIVEGEVTINPQPNGISYTSYSLKNDKYLPVGLTLSSNGVISGMAYKSQPTETFTIVASNDVGQSEAVITITVNNNVCEKDGLWYAVYVGMEVENECSIPLAKEVRKCQKNDASLTAEWGSVDGQCTMVMIVTIAIAVVVVLVVIIVLILVIRNGSGRVRYSPKKAQVKMIELAGV